VQHLLHSHPSISPALILIVTAIVFTLLNENFAKPNTISLLFQQTAIIGALAIGQTLIILTAGIDLSVGAIAILSMMVMATVATENGVPAPLALAIGIGVGVAAGALNGLLVTRIGLPPFIVTLGTLSIFTALALLYSGGQSIQGGDLPSLLNYREPGLHRQVLRDDRAARGHRDVPRGRVRPEPVGLGPARVRRR